MSYLMFYLMIILNTLINDSDKCWYIGRSDKVRRGWSKHKSDWNNGNRTYRLATNGQDVQHPADPQLQYLTVLPIDFTEPQ